MLDKVLFWINEQDVKYISKGDLYDQVMSLRPEEDLMKDFLGYSEFNRRTTYPYDT